MVERRREEDLQGVDYKREVGKRWVHLVGADGIFESGLVVGFR